MVKVVVSAFFLSEIRTAPDKNANDAEQRRFTGRRISTRAARHARRYLAAARVCFPRFIFSLHTRRPPSSTSLNVESKYFVPGPLRGCSRRSLRPRVSPLRRRTARRAKPVPREKSPAVGRPGVREAEGLIRVEGRVGRAMRQQRMSQGPLGREPRLPAAQRTADLPPSLAPRARRPVPGLCRAPRLDCP